MPSAIGTGVTAWRRSGVLDKTIRLSGRSSSIVGVMPSSFLFPDRERGPLGSRHRKQPVYAQAIQVAVGGPAEAGVSAAQARANLAVFSAREQYPETDRDTAPASCR